MVFSPTFAATSPCATPSTTESGECASSLPETTSGPRHQTILIVDDDSAFRITAAMMLQCHGFKTVAAGNGMEALCLLEKNSGIDAVLLDLLMPVMNGEETFRQLRNFWAKIPVILMSGYDPREASQRFGENPPEGFVQKPFDFARLAGALAALRQPLPSLP